MTITLEAGGYRARLTRVGAALETFTHEGRPLVLALDGAEPVPRYRGAVLAPWPNRIADGRYTFDGREHQVPITEPQRGTALHGLVAHQPWDVGDHDDTTARFDTIVAARPGYPFTLDVAVAYSLDAASGLTITLTTRNVGADDAPYGVSVHPYLCAGDGVVDDWTFGVAANEVLDVDPVRLLPRERRPVDGTDFDFRASPRLGEREVDHALTAIDFDAHGTASAVVLADDGHGVVMTWDRTCPWLQVHTTDLPGEPAHRRGLAVEPMTCAPDAFNSGAGLLRLAPGEQHTVRWAIRAV